MKTTAVEQVVAEDESTTFTIDEVLADQKGFGDAVRFSLGCVGEFDAPLGAVTEKPLEQDGRPGW